MSEDDSLAVAAWPRRHRRPSRLRRAAGEVHPSEPVAEAVIRDAGRTSGRAARAGLSWTRSSRRAQVSSRRLRRLRRCNRRTDQNRPWRWRRWSLASSRNPRRAVSTSAGHDATLGGGITGRGAGDGVTGSRVMGVTSGRGFGRNALSHTCRNRGLFLFVRAECEPAHFPRAQAQRLRPPRPVPTVFQSAGAALPE